MGHSHNHQLPDSQGNLNRAFTISVLLNLSFTVIEAFYAISANSMSLLADAAHNFGDVFGLVLAWGANWLLSRAAKERYSYGYKKTTILAALINALILVATSALIAYESIEKLMHPVQVQELTVIIVAIIGIAINGGTAVLFLKGRKNDLNIKGAFLHLAADALVSVGVAIAGGIIFLTNWVWLDPMTGLLIVVVIIIGTWGLLRDSIDLILAAAPSSLDYEGVKRYLSEIPMVERIHDLHIWGLSTKEIALTAHLVLPESEITKIDHEKINHDLLDKFKVNHVTIQVESSSQANACEQNGTC